MASGLKTILLTLGLTTSLLAAAQPGVVFVDQMEDLKNWRGDDNVSLSISKVERQIGQSSLHIKYTIDKSNPGAVWFARTNVGIDRAPAAVHIWVNIPQAQRFSWYPFPKLRMVVHDADGTAMYADIDKKAERPIYEGGRSFYISWAQVLLTPKDFYPLWPGKNNKLDGIQTISFELPHRAEDFMEDGEFDMYFDELSVLFDNADTYLKQTAENLKIQHAALQAKLDALPKNTWKKYPQASLGMIELFLTNAMEELREGKTVRTARQLEYLTQVSNELDAQLEQAKNGKVVWPEVPDVKFTNLKVKNGTYYDGDRPVYITGFCGWVQAMDYPRYTKMGFHGISYGTSPAVTCPEENKEVSPDYLAPLIKSAGDNNVAIDLMLSAHELPGWAYQKYPDLAPSGRKRGSAKDDPLTPKNQFMPWNIDHPIFRKLVGDSVRLTVPVVRDLPALASYDLANEMWYLCHGDFDPNAFKARLEQRYQKIENLNNAWNTNFKNFSEVQLQINQPASVADLYEYNQNRVTQAFDWYTKEVKKFDPNHVIYGKIHGAWRQMIGIDKVEMAKYFTGLGSDAFTRICNPDDNQTVNFWTIMMINNGYRSLAPNSPIIDSEQHMIWYRQIVTYDYVRALLWWRAVVGLDANYAWLWDRNFENAEDNIFTQPWAFHALGQTSLDLIRLSQPVSEFQHLRPDVLLVDQGAKTTDAYKLCSYSGRFFDFLPPEAFTQDRLRSYKTIIIPAGAKINAAAQDLIKSSGAKVIDVNEKTTLTTLTSDMESAWTPLAQPQHSVVQYNTVNAGGQQMAFLLNLNPEPVSVRLNLPKNTKAVDLLSDTNITGDSVELNPLKPMMIVNAKSAQ